MAENKEKVIGWIRSGMDYNEGISLLVEITRKQLYFNQFTGGMRSMSGKLAYELCKASGAADLLNWKQFILDISAGKDPRNTDNRNISFKPEPPKQHPLRVTVSIQEVELNAEKMEENPQKEYPAIIRKIIHEYASMFQERSKLHTVMADMPESNTEAIIIKRAEMFNVIKTISARLELLYKAKEQFEKTGELPNEKELFPPEEQPEEEDITKLDEESLKKRKKNLQNSNSKDQSFLDYQSAAHGSEKNPMPAGPKRKKIEHRMKQRSKQMEEIDNALLKYVIKE
ncbi:MAG: hypothetical protein WCI31_06305 [Prolixibacteraceae bacterium]